MKKLLIICACICALAVFVSFCFAGQECPMMKKGWFGMRSKEPGSEKGNMHGMMMKKMMMEKQLVATQDGGLVILFGNKLIKYDANLNLIKEAELKIDMEAMMKQMKECHEMMEKHMKEPESQTK